jgi:glycosyltransferase involved in cell wall biosynthesis
VSSGSARGERPRIAFVFEEHLGHYTHALNVRRIIEARTDIDASWVTVQFAESAQWWEHLPSEPIRLALRGRREVATGLSGADPDVIVYNTQVPAAIGPRHARARPYVLCSDVTPKQLDDLARDYEHRVDRTAFVRWAKYRWNRVVAQRAAALAPWSHWVADSLIDDYGVDPDHIEVIPPGVDTSLWTPAAHDAGPARILFVGGDFTRKGGDVLLAAFAALPPGSAELHVVTKSSIQTVPGVTVHTGLGPNSSELRELFRRSHVFVLPSRSETFGIAAIEAGAAGLPLVVAEVGGLGDLVIDGVTGYVVRPGHRDDLAAALQRLVADADLRRTLGAEARRRVERDFSLQRNADRLVDLALRCIR